MTHPTHVQERNQEATTYVGDLDPQVTEALLWELMLQAGPVVNVHIPRDKVTGSHSGFGFVEFRSEEDADYAIKIMNMIKLHGRAIRVNKASADKKTADVGANLFVGNLDPDVDEKLLYDTFSAFGIIISTPKVMRDQGSGESRGFGFISYDNFDNADAAINAMNGQYLCGRPINVTYALKKDGKGERHGSEAERILSANNPSRQTRSNPMPAAPFMVPPAGAGAGAGAGYFPPPGGAYAPPYAASVFPPGYPMMPPPGFAPPAPQVPGAFVPPGVPAPPPHLMM